MNKPDSLTTKQSNARPKDGTDGRQSPDSAKPNPNPIYTDASHGDFGDQAHHAISGNEIMKGEAIEKLIQASDLVEKDTGYSINNCANGVYLPDKPKKFAGKWGGMDYDKKLEIMKLPMKASKGQAHIGPHKGHLDPGMESFHRTYPDAVKEMLEDLRKRVLLWPAHCPVCQEDDEQKSPLPPPYRLNGYLDGLSKKVMGHLTAAPSSWEYFVSKYSKDYHKEVCTHGKKRKLESVKASMKKAKK